MKIEESGLFKLPLELRQTIYEYAFTKEVRIVSPTISQKASQKLRLRFVPCFPAGKAPRFGVKERNTGLLGTCRQIREESIKFYYRCTIFTCFASAEALVKFFETIPPQYQQEIRNVHIWMVVVPIVRTHPALGLLTQYESSADRRRKLKAKLVNIEASLQREGIFLAAGALKTLAPLPAVKNEPSRHIWTSEPTDLEEKSDG